MRGSEINGDKDAKMVVMMSILEKMGKQEEHVSNFKGSIKGTVARDRLKGAHDLYHNYFKPDPIFHECLFGCRFKMSSHLFQHIVDDVKKCDHYFTLQKDSCIQLSFSPM